MNKILGLIVVVFSIALLYRPAMGRLYEYQGVTALQASIHSEGVNPDDFACMQPPFASPSASNDLHIAITKFYRSASFWDTAHIHLLLGKTHCYAGQIEKAIEHYLTSTQLRPNNLLARMEMAAAYSAACNPEVADKVFSTYCFDNAIAHEVQQTLEKNNQDPERFIILAYSAFEKKNYSDTARYFLYYSSYSFRTVGLTDTDRFMWVVSAIMIGKSPPKTSIEALPVTHVHDGVRINSDQLRWMRKIADWNIDYGDKPQILSVNGEQAAFIARNGSLAVIIYVSVARNYSITIEALDAPPSPILALIEVNGNTLGEAAFVKGDSTWERKTYEVLLESGYHIISVEFTNDGFINNVDRNLLINSIEVSSTGD
jgi:tetratricopeptide (TPR) repeat protein